MVKCCVHLRTRSSKTQMLLLEKNIFHKHWLFCYRFIALTFDICSLLSGLSFLNNSKNNATTPSSNQRLWRDSGQILRHQYEISVAETQTFILAKRPQRRGAWRNGCFRRLIAEEKQCEWHTWSAMSLAEESGNSFLEGIVELTFTSNYEKISSRNGRIQLNGRKRLWVCAIEGREGGGSEVRRRENWMSRWSHFLVRDYFCALSPHDYPEANARHRFLNNLHARQTRDG